MDEFKFICLTFFMALNPLRASAQAPDASLSGSNAEITLTIQPHICIAPRGESSCISRIDVFWSSTELTDVCLYVNVAAENLECWEQSKSGMYQHKVIVVKNLDYWMTSMNQQNIWAKSSVKFAVLKPHRKQKRRRNHLPWSIQSL